MAGNPWFKFYPSDWRGSARLRSCSPGARALLVEMMCIMHDAEPYGYLIVADKPITTDRELARQVAIPARKVAAFRTELEHKSLISRDENGTIFNPRMVRDEEIRKKRAAGGNASTREPGKRSGSVGQLFNFLLEKWGGCLWCGGVIGLELHRLTPGRHGGKYEPGNVLLLCRNDHENVEDGVISVPDILAKNMVQAPLDLFQGFSHPLFPSPNKGMSKGIAADTAKGYTQIPDARSQSKASNRTSASALGASAAKKDVENSDPDPTDGDLMALVRKRFYAPDGKPPTNWDEGREFTIFRQMHKAGIGGRQIAAWIEGAAAIRDDDGMVRSDMGQVDWLKRGEKMTMRCLYHTRSGVMPLVQLAEIKLAEIGKTTKPTLFEKGQVGTLLRNALKAAG